MKKTILAYGGILSLFIILLKWLDYKFLLRDISIEIYIAAVATLFASIGIWMGLKMTKPKIISTASGSDFVQDSDKINELGISNRELDVLVLMAQGHSNQEIADTLFISLNTVKTHSSSLFSKLAVKRRTQAIQKAKNWYIIE